MKQITISVIVLFLSAGGAFGQNEVDALRYSQVYYGGTARSVSMAGSFGALGGDFSSLSINPGGIGVYRKSELTGTPTILFSGTSTDYLGRTSTDNRYQFLMNNFGYVYSNLTGRDAGWVSYSIGIGYNRLNNFHRNVLMAGIQESGNPNSSSLLDNFTNYANDGGWDKHFEELAWSCNLLPYDTLAGEYWNDIADAGYGQFQRRRIKESGGIGEYIISFGANYGDKLYIGSSLSYYRMIYNQELEHFEADDDLLVPLFDAFTFRNYIDVDGRGVSGKFGLIYRPIDFLRFGAAFHLPVFYSISERFHNSMESYFDPGNTDLNDYDRSLDEISEYKLRTPFRFIGSIAFQVRRLVTFNLDYEYLDYSTATLDSREYGYYSENDFIKAIYAPAHNLRGGAEFRIGQLYLRGGIGRYQSAFTKNEINSKAHTWVFSGGMGYRMESFFIDFGYALNKRDTEIYYLYIPEDVFGADISTNTSQFLTTLGFRF